MQKKNIKEKVDYMGNIIAVGGKGGVGKTFVSAILTKILKDKAKLLSIDADPSLGLTYAFGISPESINTIWDIREALKDGSGRKRLLGDQDPPLKDVIREKVVLKKNGFDFLVMGRSEGPGCFCSINELLRYAIDSLAKEYEVVIVDCEAGLEQVNRRVLRNIDTLLLVSDPTVRGIQTIRYLSKIACNLSEKEKLSTKVVFNMVEDISSVKRLAEQIDIPVIGYIPSDKTVKEYDLLGKSLVEFPTSSPAFQALLECTKLAFGYLYS